MIKHIHSSGRFDRSPESLRRATKSYIEKGANLITFTEIHRGERADALKFEGFRLVWVKSPTNRGADDPAVLVKDSDFIVVGAWAKQLSRHEQRRGPGGPPPPSALTVLLRDRRTKKLFMVSVAHLPSNVEGSWFKREVYWRVFVWRDCVKTWRSFLAKKRNQYTNKVIVIADWNLNFKRRAIRLVVKRYWPGLSLTWRGPWPSGGTHFKRIIDGTMTNLDIEEYARLLEDDGSSDHRPYLDEMSL